MRSFSVGLILASVLIADSAFAGGGMSSDAANCVAIENQNSPLPDELWWLVLSFLPKPDVANARCVCRFLRDIIDNEDLFTTARLRGHYCLKHSLRLPVHIDAAAAFSPDGRMLVCIMANHRAPVEVRAYDVAIGNETFALVPTFVDPTDGAQHLVVASPHDITVSPNGQTFAFATSNPGYVGIIATDTLDTLHMALHDPPWMANTWGPATVRFSPDGNHLLSTLTGASPQILDLANRETSRLDSHGSTHRIVRAEFSPDQRFIATLAHNDEILIWNFRTRSVAQTLSLGFWSREMGNPLVCVAFSPDSNNIAAGTHRGKVAVWNVETGRLDREFWSEQPTNSQHRPASIRSICFSPQGARLLVTASSGRVELWQWQKREPQLAYALQAGHANAAFFSPCGDHIAALSNHSIEVRTIAPVVYGSTAYYRKVFGQVRQTAANASAPSSSQPLDPETIRATYRKTLGQYRGAFTVTHEGAPNDPQGDYVRSIAFTGNGARLATASRSEIKMIDPSSGDPLGSIVTGRPPSGARPPASSTATGADASGTIFFSAGDLQLVSSIEYPDVAIYGADTGAPLTRFKANIDAPSASPSSAVAFASGGRAFVVQRDNTLSVCDVQTGAQTSAVVANGIHNPVLALAPLGNIIAASWNDDVVRIFDVHTQRRVHLLRRTVWPLISQTRVDMIAFSPNGKRVVVTYDDGVVWIWNVTTGQLASKLGDNGFLFGSTYRVHAATFSNDGTRLAIGTASNKVEVWDAEQGQLLATYSDGTHNDTYGVTAVAFSPDGHLLASASGNRVTVRTTYFPPD